MDRQQEKWQEVIPSPGYSNTHALRLFYPMILRISNKKHKSAGESLHAFLTQKYFPRGRVRNYKLLAFSCTF